MALSQVRLTACWRASCAQQIGGSQRKDSDLRGQSHTTDPPCLRTAGEGHDDRLLSRVPWCAPFLSSAPQRLLRRRQRQIFFRDRLTRTVSSAPACVPLSDWDWPSGNKFAGGRSALPPDFMAQTRRDLIELAWAQKELLLLPITSRTRTLAAKDAEAERARSAAALRRCDDRVAAALDSLSMAVETMKAAGMPGARSRLARSSRFAGGPISSFLCIFVLQIASQRSFANAV